MIKEANRVCSRLWKDESGVVFLFTIVVFLTLFVIACTVYAVGENIRQRIELQNAADAAAYSAAIVQADTLSRIAAINKAMAWTYINMCRHHMEYIQHKWLELVVSRFDNSYGTWQHVVNSSYSVRPRDAWIGANNKTPCVELNRNGSWISIDTIRSKVNSFPLQRLVGDIAADRSAITSMNTKERELINGLPIRISDAVTAILSANVRDPSGDVRFALLQSAKPIDEISCIYGGGEDFTGEFGFLNGIAKKSEDLGRGHSTWFPAQPDIDGGGRKAWGDSRFRRYVQRPNALTASWTAHVYGKKTKNSDRQLLLDSPGGATGDEADLDGYRETTPKVDPRRLRKNFFRREGAIVVGVARRMNNPFQFMGAQGSSDLGVFNSFALGTRQRYAWAVSAARAGYLDAGRPDLASYNPTLDCWKMGDANLIDNNTISYSRSQWQTQGWAMLSDPDSNLFTTDWDAVLLPIKRSWCARTPAWQDRALLENSLHGQYSSLIQAGRWTPEEGTGREIFDHLWSKPEWKRLPNGDDAQPLQRLTDDSAPSGKTGQGATVEWSDVLYH